MSTTLSFLSERVSRAVLEASSAPLWSACMAEAAHVWMPSRDRALITPAAGMIAVQDAGAHAHG
ncbi:hypothetical protein [Paraburkholderia sp. J7]|uniref:hypothetical protein n=1 Tax=Paraburkholderia sp. J7 TaxID=2805438 RepID=UPI002AB6E2C7|nr:hypothetical protein [Paraburkholderia sp. J7]